MKKSELTKIIKEAYQEVLNEDMYSYEQKALRQQIEQSLSSTKLNEKEKLMILKSIIGTLEGGNTGYTNRY